jgi:hypothetical protein
MVTKSKYLSLRSEHIEARLQVRARDPDSIIVTTIIHLECY